jgi:hypothetical protein
MGQGLMVSDPTLSRGGGLEEMGMDSAKRAGSAAEVAAESESERNQYNARVIGANKEGNSKLGGMVGSIAGSYFGPLGSAIGGSVGGLIGGAF